MFFQGFWRRRSRAKSATLFIPAKSLQVAKLTNLSSGKPREFDPKDPWKGHIERRIACSQALPWTPCFWRYLIIFWTPKNIPSKHQVHLRRYSPGRLGRYRVQGFCSRSTFCLSVFWVTRKVERTPPERIKTSIGLQCRHPRPLYSLSRNCVIGISGRHKQCYYLPRVLMCICILYIYIRFGTQFFSVYIHGGRTYLQKIRQTRNLRFS